VGHLTGAQVVHQVIIPVILEAWDDGRHGMAFRDGAGNNGTIMAFRFDLQWDGSTDYLQRESRAL
jgi:hypothetical protein